MTNTRVATRPYIATSINAFYSKKVTLCLDTWGTSYNCSTVQRHYFLTFRGKNYKSLQPSFSKSSG